MSSKTEPEKGDTMRNNTGLDPKLKDHEAGVGIDGRAAHGGDVAPPNSDDAGRRQSPESGPPDKA